MKRSFCAALVSTALLTGPVVNAADFNVEIVNLTNGITFTPFLIAAHPEGNNFFSAGQPASANLQTMAEGGDIGGLSMDMQAVGATIAENPAGGLLMPGMSTNADLNTDDTANVELSVIAMLLPTNDAFAALNGVTIPTMPGTYTFNLPAYDAGTEANDELITGGGMPGVPGIPFDPIDAQGTGGTGVAAADANSNVHIHRNTLGDTNPTGGASDLDSTVHRWLNPVVRVIVTVR